MQSAAQLCGISMMSNGMGLELNSLYRQKKPGTWLWREWPNKAKHEFKESFWVRIEKWKFILFTEIPIAVIVWLVLGFIMLLMIC